jgi:hypothetical protein
MLNELATLQDWEARFSPWFEKVDAIITATTGLGALDWTDQTYSEWFDDGMTPEEAAKEALENIGWIDE